MDDDDYALKRFQFASPPSADFKKWHRPRKQYVRAEHWGAEITRLFDELDDDAPLRYFGLPGRDFLDIRYFVRACCAEKGRQIRFLGFDKGAEESIEDDPGGLASLRRHELVHSRSAVFRQQLEDLGNVGSLAGEEFRNNGPFDVINLDLCDGIAGVSPFSDHGMYSAVKAIFALQNRRSRPWLLFLTTRVDADNVAPFARAEMMSLIVDNFRTCPDFVKALMQYTPGALPGSDGSLSRPHVLPVVGLCKWLLKIGVSYEFDVLFPALSIYRVVNSGGDPDMASLVLKFVPQVRAVSQDRGLPIGRAIAVDECKWAARIPEAVAGATDLDEVLASDEITRERLIAETVELLVETGRYAEEDYRKWLAEIET
ncbi:hypothetical protein OG589_40650 [Sphaerisporangium sp. NBC_01403]|uniref:PP_RS20740 family protein n=1 Tax=Sphaerisporangium sp. NBC_01403 TaxID=2903599 RepID=UPI00324640D0